MTTERAAGRIIDMRGRPQLAAWTLGGIAVLGCAVSMAVWVWAGLPATPLYDGYLASNLVMALSFAPLGALLAARRPDNALGWLMLTFGFCFGVGTPIGAIALAELVKGHLHAFETLFPIFMAIWPISIYACLPLLLQLYPTGRPAGRRRGWLLFAVIPSALIGVANNSLAPSLLGIHGLPNPRVVAISPATFHRFDPIWQVGEPLDGLVMLASLVVLLSRLRRAEDMARQQILWLLWSAGIFVLLNAERFATGNGPIVLLFGIVVVAASIGVALLRYRLLDIDVVIQRSVVFAILTALLLAAYFAVVELMDWLLGHEASTAARLIATGAIAVGFAPLRARIQLAVERYVYGRRGEPYALLTQLGTSLAEAPAPQDVLASVVDTVADGLRLWYVGLEVTGTEGTSVVAARGSVVDRVERIPLRYQGEHVGALVVGVHPGERELQPQVRNLLRDLAGQVGVTVRNAALQSALQRSHERLVSAREEERRRLRRDLHDGLGPQLTGVTLKADAARNLLHRDPAGAEQLIEQLRTDTTSAIADVRRLVYALRPPALDSLGLLGALELEAERLSVAGMRVHVRPGPPLPLLPAAVEVAAYRIASEAVANAARHSRAHLCTVAVDIDGDLRIEVTDDGPSQHAWLPGVGMVSMRERAVELGGSFAAGPSHIGGRVAAVLPLQRS